MQDGGLHVRQRGRRIGTQFLGDRGPCPPERIERLTLASGAIVGQRQQLPRPFAQGIGAHHRLQCGRRRVVIAAVDARGLQLFEGVGADGCQAGRLDIGELPPLGVGIGSAGPEIQCGLDGLASARGVVGGELGRSARDGAFEPAGVDGIVGDGQRVSGAAANEDRRIRLRVLGFEHAPQRRDVALKRRGRRSRRVSAPQVVDDDRRGDGVAGGDHQAGQQRARHRTAERPGSVVDDGRE